MVNTVEDNLRDAFYEIAEKHPEFEKVDSFRVGELWDEVWEQAGR